MLAGRPSWIVAVAALLLALAAIARPQDGASYTEVFLEAERAERTLGDLETAATLYEQAATLAPGDVAARASAEVRAGSCRRRLGDKAKARPLISPWAQAIDGVPEALTAAAIRELAALGATTGESGNGTPPVGLAPAAEVERQLTSLRRENDELQRRLEGALERAEKVDEEELARLVDELNQRDQHIETLRAELETYSPRTAADALELRRRENRERAGFQERLARRHYQEGRFADARAFCSNALKLDPDNAGARALLARISAPLGDRERLFEEILEAEALARQVRVGRMEAEIASLVDGGRQRQTKDDHAASIAPLERALGLLDGLATEGAVRPERRVEVLALLREAERAGATRKPVPAEDLPRPDGKWSTALRDLLADAGDEVVPGLQLKFHDLDRALAVAGSGLPPVGPRPFGWTLAADRVASADLLTAYLASTEQRGLAAPGSRIRVIGHTAVVVARDDVQRRFDQRITALAIHPGGSVVLRIAARRGAPGEWEAWLAARGLRSESLPGGARVAIVPPEPVRALNALLEGRPVAVFARAELAAAPFRAFMLAAGSAAAPLTLRVLPVGGDIPGVGVHATVAWTPEGQPDGARLVQEAVGGGALEPGGGLVLYGLRDPADLGREIAVVVQLRGDDPSGTVVAPDGPVQPGTFPPEESPPSRDGVEAAHYPLPARVAGLHEVGPAALHVPDHVVPSRVAALRRRLEALREKATVLEVREDEVVVVGPPETHRAVREFLRRVGAASLATFDVELHQVEAKLERQILEQVKSWSQAEGGFFWAIVRREERALAVTRLLARGGRQLPLAERRVSAPATGRRDVALVLRSVYRRGLEVREGPEPAWGRSETAWVDEGVLLALRPFGRTENGQVDLDLSLRAAFVNDRGAATQDTALGRVATLRPRLASVWGDLSLQARPGELIVLAGLPNPFPSDEQRDRLVVLVRPIE